MHCYDCVELVTIDSLYIQDSFGQTMHCYDCVELVTIDSLYRIHSSPLTA